MMKVVAMGAGRGRLKKSLEKAIEVAVAGNKVIYVSDEASIGVIEERVRNTMYPNTREVKNLTSLFHVDNLAKLESILYFSPGVPKVLCLNNPEYIKYCANRYRRSDEEVYFFVQANENGKLNVAMDLPEPDEVIL